MEAFMFTDYYEILEISPHATFETIDRMFRYLAKRYHPDNQDTGDVRRFSAILDAHTGLKDPVKRAEYDIEHKNHMQLGRKLVEEASDSKGAERDVDIQDKLLSVFYVKRRQDIKNPGMSEFELERLLGSPEHLDFHLWYLREKGWIRRNEDGMLAITVEGVDRAKSEDHRAAAKLLTDQSQLG
jgi:curved DNA-binding protein CbpA